MLDNSGAPDPTPTAPVDGAPPSPSPADAAASILGGDADPGGGDSGDTGSGPAVEPTWREDWRERLVEKLPAAERDKELTRLKRFSSIENLYKSNRELERRMSSGQVKATLPEGATEDEVKAYRKAHGIPETADAYGIEFPAEIETTAGDKADLAAFTKDMLDANIAPAQAKAAFASYLKMRSQALEQAATEAHERTINQQAELRAEYGKEFKANATMANNFVAKYAGETGGEIMKLRLADGTLLGDNPNFVRFAVSAARDTAEDDMLVTVPGGGSVAVIDRYKAIMNNPKATAAERAEAQSLAVEMERKGINFAL